MNPYIDDILIYTNNVMSSRTFRPVNIPSSYSYTVSDQDIQNGEIVRYFCKPVNQQSPSSIQEISEVIYTQLQNNRFYVTTSLRWKIVGSLNDVVGLTPTGDTIILSRGIESANKASVNIANEFLSGLNKVIVNYTKYYQGY